YVAKEIPGVENVTTLAGYSLVNEVAGASYGMGMINLNAWDQRDKNVYEVIEELERKTQQITDARIEFFPPPTVTGFGNSSGFELRLLDRSGQGNINKTAEVTATFINELKKAPEINNVFTSFDASFPQYLIHIDYDMAAKMGITVDKAMSNLQTLVGSFYATNFIRFNQMYK